VIAIGASQSAGRLSTYINAIHPLPPSLGGRTFNGYMLQIYFGSGTPIEASDRPPPIDRNAPRQTARPKNLIRDDLDVPAMIINTELEAIACFDVRQPDTEKFVTWESAALTHVSYQAQVIRNKKYDRDFGITPPAASEEVNRIYIQPYYDAALNNMNRWVNTGIPAPSQPLINFNSEGEVIRDEHGIAEGGIRLPQAAVPVAVNSSIPVTQDFSGRLRGSNKPFDSAKLKSMYGDENSYLKQFKGASNNAVEAGVMLTRDITPALEEATFEYRRSASK